MDSSIAESLTQKQVIDLKHRLKQNWSVVAESKLELTLVFADFKAVIEFVNRVADLAQKLNHHPDLYIYGYKRLRIDLSTHIVNRITSKDFEFAQEIEKIL